MNIDYNQILNTLPGVFYLIDNTGKFVKWNKNFELITGYSNEEFEKIKPVDLFEGEDKALIENKIGEVFQSGETIVEATVVTKKNEKIPFLFNGISVEIDNETYLSGMGIDMREKVEAEEKLKESEERFKTLFESAPDTFYIYDMKGNFLDGNKASEKITGYKREELIGKSFLKLKLLSPSSIPIAASSLLKVVRGEKSGPDRYKLVRKDGTKVMLEVISLPVELGGRKVGLGIARDITSRLETENKLKRRNKELESFNRVAVDRELRMAELKKEIKELKKKNKE